MRKADEEEIDRIMAGQNHKNLSRAQRIGSGNSANPNMILSCGLYGQVRPAKQLAKNSVHLPFKTQTFNRFIKDFTSEDPAL